LCVLVADKKSADDKDSDDIYDELLALKLDDDFMQSTPAQPGILQTLR